MKVAEVEEISLFNKEGTSHANGTLWCSKGKLLIIKLHYH